MSAAELDNPAFQDDDLAREWFEARIWPDGPKCPHCGSFGEGVTRMFGKKHRPGCFQCNACREQFTVTVGTVMERSKIPLHIWLKAMYLLSASKKGMSTHQLHRMLGVSLKSTWFLMMRIREAMREPFFGTQMGGFRKPVQADETFIGRRTSRAGEVRQRGYAEKEPVLTLIGDKKVRSFHVPEVNSATLKPILREQIDKAAMVFTDEASYYAVCAPISRPAISSSITTSANTSAAARRQWVRKLLLDPETRHQRRLSARQPDASEAVRRRVRFPLQQPHRAWASAI